MHGLDITCIAPLMKSATDRLFLATLGIDGVVEPITAPEVKPPDAA